MTFLEHNPGVIGGQGEEGETGVIGGEDGDRGYIDAVVDALSRAIRLGGLNIATPNPGMLHSASRPLPPAPEKREFSKINPLTILVGGGGIYGILGAGALRELIDKLEDSGLSFETIHMTGASAGSIVSTVFALYGKEKLRDVGLLQKMTGAFHLQIDRHGLFDSDKLKAMLYELFGDRTFQDCLASNIHKPSVNLCLAVTDLREGKPILLHAGNYAGPLWKLIYASCAIPGVFKPALLKTVTPIKGRAAQYEFVEHNDKHDPSIQPVADGSFTADAPLPKLLELLASGDLQPGNIGQSVVIRSLPGLSILQAMGKPGTQVLNAFLDARKWHHHLVDETIPVALRVTLKNVLAGMGFLGGSISALQMLFATYFHAVGLSDVDHKRAGILRPIEIIPPLPEGRLILPISLGSLPPGVIQDMLSKGAVTMREQIPEIVARVREEQRRQFEAEDRLACERQISSRAA